MSSAQLPVGLVPPASPSPALATPIFSQSIEALICALEDYRKTTGFTYEQLAKEAGISLILLGEALRTDIYRSRISTIASIARVLGLRVLMKTTPLDTPLAGSP